MTDTVYPDRTKRAWEEITAACEDFGDNAAGWWIAIRLSDGGSDRTLYPSKMDAVKYQLHEKQCAYLCIHPFGEMSIKDVHRYLELNEKIYDAGGRLEDEGTHVVPGRNPLH
jgi:hypothetical protein